MCRWNDADCLVSLNVAITHFFMNFKRACCDYKIETKLAVRSLEVERISAFEVPCGWCCVKRESEL